MAISLDEFWKLLVDSGLLAAAECDDLKSAFARVPGADQGNTKTLCAWLMDRGMLSRYQARLLLAGRAGPFFFGDYRVYDRVESGRLSGMFRAAHRENGEPVLLYFFSGSATRDLRVWLPVEARAQLAVAVKHPNVSRVDGLIQADGYKFLVVEGLDGTSLDELSQGKPLPLADVCRYLRKAVTGLARLHNLNQVHADIRPDTLWLEHSGQLKLLYFPLSRDPLGPAAALSPNNADYLAPECTLPGGKSPDALSDIYSLGCTAYHLLSGQVPFPGGDAADKGRRHAGEASVPLEQLTGLPCPAANLISRMMAKNPQERPATAMRVADELSALTATAGGNEARTANGQQQPAKANGQTPSDKPSRAAAKPPGAAARPSGAAARPPGAAAEPRGSAQARPTASRTAPATGPTIAAARPTATPAATAPHAAPPRPTQSAPLTGNAPPPPPIHAPQGGWPAAQPLAGTPSSMPPVMPQPSNMAPPPPPSGFAPQPPAFGAQPAPVMGVPVAGVPPMGMPAAGMPAAGMPAAGMPMFAPQGFAAPQGYATPQGYPAPQAFATPQVYAAPQGYAMPQGYAAPEQAFAALDFTSPAPQAYGAPQEQVPLVGERRKPAAFDSSVINVLDEAAAGPATSPASKAAARPGAAASPTAPARRIRQQQQGLSPQTIGLGVGSLAIVLVSLGVFAMTRGSGEPAGDPSPVAIAKTSDEDLPPKTVVKKPPGEQADEEDAEEKPKPPSKKGPPKDSGPQIVDDDGQSLWVSPTAGPPIDAQYLPPGTQALLVLRPHDLLNSPDGEKVLAALGPGGAWAKSQVETISGVGLADMEQIIVAFSSLEKGSPPQAAFVVRLSEPRTTEQLLPAWGNPAAASDGKAYFAGPAWAYYMPPAGQNKVLAICGAKEMGEVVDMDGPPPMRKEMEKLLRQSDAQRHVTLLVAPNYLENDGKPLLEGELERLRNPLAEFFGETVQAAALSLNFGQEFFAELRMYSTDIGPEDLARQTRERIGQIPGQVEELFVNISPHPYGKLVLGRFAQMLRIVDEYVRMGEEENQAILRCFLPLSAGHNLIMATELALFERGGGGSGGAVAKKPVVAGPAGALQQKITLSFARDTLEKTMEMLGKEIDTEIVILGSDLQLEGITKNQSFGLDEKDKPAGEILRTVMMKANPDGKLIYVFKPKNPGEKDIIFITTRASADKRGDKVPPELAKPADAGKAKAKK